MVESMAGGARGQTWRLSISQGDVAEVYGTGFPSTRSTEGERDREGREQRPAAVAASSGGERLGRRTTAAGRRVRHGTASPRPRSCVRSRERWRAEGGRERDGGSMAGSSDFSGEGFGAAGPSTRQLRQQAAAESGAAVARAAAAPAWRWPVRQRFGAEGSVARAAQSRAGSRAE